MVTVSVVIPVKDDAEKLRRCLEALRGQLAESDEIIVVDNASTQDIAAIASDFGARYVFEALAGIAAAASAGYDAARGEVIARLDADSVPTAQWADRLRDFFAHRPHLSAVTGPGGFGSLPGPMAWIADRLYMRAYFRVFGRALGRPPLFGSNFAMTNGVWLFARSRVHRDDARVHDDLDLSFCLPPGAQVVLDPDLRVSISARPFANPLAFARRIGRAIHTVSVNRRSPEHRRLPEEERV